MSFHRDFKRGASTYRRGKLQFPSTGKSFLIVTEGAKTEPNYFKALRDRLEINAAEVLIIHPNGTDPITLTRDAINRRSAKKKEAKRGLEIPYDEVWVVFDLEQTHDVRRRLAHEAMQMKDAAGINFATSDPCFEYWLLLHSEFTTRPFNDCATVMQSLNKHIVDYSKGGVFPSEYLDKIPIATKHAHRCREYHKMSGGDGNPSTKVDHLVRSLNSATRPHCQFSLS